MAARAEGLGDVGESSPEHWEKPLGSPDVHVVITAVSTDEARTLEPRSNARATPATSLPGVAAIWRQDCHVLPGEREPFGFKDGISHPAIEGSGVPGTNPHEVAAESRRVRARIPRRDGRHADPSRSRRYWDATAVTSSFRKLHQRVAAFRHYVRAKRRAGSEELLGRKDDGTLAQRRSARALPRGRRSGVGDDPERNNDFLFRADDPIGYKTPLGSHIRRINPRDADIAGVVRIHRMIRRGTAYGPALPDGVMEDDGVDRGLMFAFVGANLGRQFEFVQSEWMNDSAFFGDGQERDPVSGDGGDGEGTYNIPRRPLRRRLKGLSRFVITRGGEYCFVPSLRALRWLSELRD